MTKKPYLDIETDYKLDSELAAKAADKYTVVLGRHTATIKDGVWTCKTSALIQDTLNKMVFRLGYGDWVPDPDLYEVEKVKELFEGKAIKGGPGSGNWGHAGRPGKRGGSAQRYVGYTPSKEAQRKLGNYLRATSQKRRKVEEINKELESLGERTSVLMEKESEAFHLTRKLVKEADSLDQSHPSIKELDEQINKAHADQKRLEMESNKAWEKIRALQDERSELYDDLRGAAGVAIGAFNDNPVDRGIYAMDKHFNFGYGHDGQVKDGLKYISKELVDKLGGQLVVPMYRTDRKRPYHQEGYVFLNDRSGAATLAHEVGHAIEFRSRAVRKIVNDFLNARTEGKETQKLKDTYEGYEDYEVYKDGGFFNPYVGKIYGQGATEILSMGMEQFVIDGGRALSVKDPAHWAITYDILHGLFED